MTFEATIPGAIPGDRGAVKKGWTEQGARARDKQLKKRKTKTTVEAIEGSRKPKKPRGCWPFRRRPNQPRS